MSCRPPEAALFDKVVDAVGCYEPDGTIVYLNPATLKLYGRTADELVGQNLWTLIPVLEGDAFYDTFNRVAKTGEPEQFDMILDELWYDCRLYLSEGHVWILGRDTTAERRAVTRLEVLSTASRVFSEAASDNSAVFETIAQHVAEVLGDLCAIRLLSLDRTRFEAPAGLWDTNEKSRAALKATPPVSATNTIPPEVLRSLQPLIILGEMNFRVVAERIAPPEHRDAIEALKIHSLMAIPMRAQGEVVGIMSVGRRLAGTRAPYTQEDRQLLEELADRAALVANQSRALRLVEHERERLAIIGDSLPALVSLLDKSGRYVFVNATYGKWFGPDPSTMIGKTPREVLGDTAYETVSGYVVRAMHGEPVSFQTRMQYATGIARDVRATYTPYLVDGRIEGIVALVVDVTETVRLEAKLQTAIASRDEFLSIASHELRTPLTTLKLQLEGLHRSFEQNLLDDDPSKALHRIAVASRQTNRLAALINALLDVSRIATGTFQLERADIDLKALTEEIVERFSEEAKRVGSPISLEASESVIGHWDRLRVDQALTNLLSNAIKYGDGKPVNVKLITEGERAQVVVRDHGIGIAEDALERIFGRFERAVSSSQYGGLGLGLYVASQIVRAHGGGIEVFSRPGEGAQFTITLPRT